MSTAAMLQRVAPALDSKSLRPEDVLQFKAPIAGYLCPVEANTFGVEFLSFEIRDYDSGRTVYSVSKGLLLHRIPPAPGVAPQPLSWSLCRPACPVVVFAPCDVMAGAPRTGLPVIAANHCDISTLP